MRSVVLIHGLLRGMGREESCEMLAIKESDRGGGQPIYSRCGVIDAPPDLPDGDYTVSFNGYAVPAKREGGLWIPEDETAAMRAEERSSGGQRQAFKVEEAAEILPALKRRNDQVA